MSLLFDHPILAPPHLPPVGPPQQVMTMTNASATFSGTFTLNGATTVAPEPPSPSAASAVHGVLYNLPFWPHGNTFLSFLLTVIAWAAIAGLVHLLLYNVLRGLVGRTRTEIDDVILRIVRAPLFIAIVAYGAVSALDELVVEPGWQRVVHNLYWVVMIAATFYLAWRIVREVLLTWLTAHAAETETQLDDLLVPLLKTVGPMLFAIAGLVIILQYLGVDIGLIVVSIGGVALIFGLAFQDSLSNLFSGIYLMVDPPFHENDLIIMPDGKICGVQRVGLRTSELYDMGNHALIYVPNNALSNATISNITKPTVDLKVSSMFRVGYNADPPRVETLLTEILQSHRNILGLPEKKLAALRRRLGQMAALVGAPGDELIAALDALNGWKAGREEDPAIHARLVEVRKQMNVRLAAAQAALQRLPTPPTLAVARTELSRALGNELAQPDQAVPLDESRMHQIQRALAQLGNALPATQLTELHTIVATVVALDQQENALEAELVRREQAREVQLDRLLMTVIAHGQQVAAALTAAGQERAADRVNLWTRNIAVQYAELEVQASVDGLDSELMGLIAWLKPLETGGLNRVERLQVRALFSQWGGVHMLEQRRVPELRRRILRWVRWKEKGVLPPSEYDALVAAWERRLRQLSRKLHEARGGDEEALDSRLVAIRSWIHGPNFIEPVTDWKLPSGYLDGLGDWAMDFGVSFYVDDIKLQHFSRKGSVLGDVLMDIYEVFKREGIEIPLPQNEVWLRNGRELPPPNEVYPPNGGSDSAARPAGSLGGATPLERTAP